VVARRLLLLLRNLCKISWMSKICEFECVKFVRICFFASRFVSLLSLWGNLCKSLWMCKVCECGCVKLVNVSFCGG